MRRASKVLAVVFVCSTVRASVTVFLSSLGLTRWNRGLEIFINQRCCICHVNLSSLPIRILEFASNIFPFHKFLVGPPKLEIKSSRFEVFASKWILLFRLWKENIISLQYSRASRKQPHIRFRAEVIGIYYDKRWREMAQYCVVYANSALFTCV